MAKKYPKGPQLTVVITDEQIKKSKVRDSSHCMIADAVKVAMPGVRKVSVDLQTIRFTHPSKPLRYTYLTPRIGQINLIAFDQGVESIEPFTMQLRGAHVTAAGHYKNANVLPKEGDDASELRHKNAVRAAELSKQTRVKLSRSVLKNDEFRVPERVGGKPPPTTPFARRRAFGLRALNP